MMPEDTWEGPTASRCFDSIYKWIESNPGATFDLNRNPYGSWWVRIDLVIDQSIRKSCVKRGKMLGRVLTELCEDLEIPLVL